MFFSPIILVLAGCSSEVELTALPSSITWGEIDFIDTVPENGFSPQLIKLSNTGEEEITSISIDRLDGNINQTCPPSMECNRLCVQGYENTPIDLGSLEPGDNSTFFVAVCEYVVETGERDDEVSGKIEISHSGTNSPTTIKWSFTPVLGVSGTETGM